MSNLISFPQPAPTPADDRRELAPEVDVSAEASGILIPFREPAPFEARFSPARRGAAVLALFAIGAVLGALLLAVVRSF